MGKPPHDGLEKKLIHLERELTTVKSEITELQSREKSLNLLQKELDHIQGDLATSQSEIQNLRSQQNVVPQSENKHKPIDTNTKAAIALVILTFLSFFVILGGTWWTIYSEKENRMLPIITLGTKDDFTDEHNPKHIVMIRNIGFGPALNANTQPVTIAGITIQLNHRTNIGAGETQSVDAQKKGDDDKKENKATEMRQFERITPDSSVPIRETLVSDFAKLFSSTPVPVCTSYVNALSEQFESWQVIYQPSTSTAENPDLAIDYRCSQQTSQPCTQTIEEACKKNFYKGVKNLFITF